MSSASSGSLRRRLITQIGMMVVGLLLLGIAAGVGINGLHHDFGDALRGYQQLREVYEIGVNVSAARAALGAETPDSAAARSAIDAATLKLDTGRTDFDDAALRTSLQMGSLASLDAANARLAAISAGIRTSIQSKQQAAEQKRQLTLIAVLGLSVVVVVGGIVLGLRQYRDVMRPLQRLGEAVRQVAAGDFSNSMPATGDREFAALAKDFNFMAAELHSLYRELEQKVAVKSRQLVRSERLASVGFLAAGVAHEINNPLGIIAGYAERALQQLQREPDRADAERLGKALSIIRDEAFRCKQITDRLLSLSRGGNDSFGPVSLPSIAEEIVLSVGTLPEYRDRRIVLKMSPQRDELFAHARDGEMKQVILNLLVNALEAVEPGSGQVRITISRTGDMIELTVADNGRGMTAQTLENVFEPFFTLNREGGRRGTGLGLSIVHAIIADHGGSIVAESAGPGLGSAFVARFPASSATLKLEGAGDVRRDR